jgi:hypothetical protein
MPTYLRPTALARYLDLAPQRISQLVNRGVLDPPGPDGFDADAVRVAYINHLRARLTSPATVGLTEERARLVRVQRERLEFKLARDSGRLVPAEEVNRLLETVEERLTDIEAGYANDIAAAARRADSIWEANAAVGQRLRGAIAEALRILATVPRPGSAKAA